MPKIKLIIINNSEKDSEGSVYGIINPIAIKIATIINFQIILIVLRFVLKNSKKTLYIFRYLIGIIFI